MVKISTLIWKISKRNHWKHLGAMSLGRNPDGGNPPIRAGDCRNWAPGRTCGDLRRKDVLGAAKCPVLAVLRILNCGGRGNRSGGELFQMDCCRNALSYRSGDCGRLIRGGLLCSSRMEEGRGIHEGVCSMGKCCGTSALFLSCPNSEEDRGNVEDRQNVEGQTHVELPHSCWIEDRGI